MKKIKYLHPLFMLSMALLIGGSGCLGLGKGSGVVEGDVDYSQPETWYARFTDKGDRVKDEKLGNVWMKRPKSGLTWYQAVDYCKSLNLDGLKWKLPSKSQLKTMLSTNRPVRKGCWLNPAFDGCGVMWASNELKDAQCTADEIKAGKKECKLGGFVDAAYGADGFDKKSEKHLVRCVTIRKK